MPSTNPMMIAGSTGMGASSRRASAVQIALVRDVAIAATRQMQTTAMITERVKTTCPTRKRPLPNKPNPAIQQQTSRSMREKDAGSMRSIHPPAP